MMDNGLTFYKSQTHSFLINHLIGEDQMTKLLNDSLVCKDLLVLIGKIWKVMIFSICVNSSV